MRRKRHLVSRGRSHSASSGASGACTAEQKLCRQRKQLVGVLEQHRSTTEEGSEHLSAGLPQCHAGLVAEEGYRWVTSARITFLFMPD